MIVMAMALSPEAILNRLQRDGHLDLLTAVRQRQISAFHAACIVGYCKRPPTKSAPGDDNRSKQRLFIERTLDVKSMADRSEILMELWLGESPYRGSVFESRDELRDAWIEHRAECMAMWAHH